MLGNKLKLYLVRGGTSKGLVINQNDIPLDCAIRDRFLLKLIGEGSTNHIGGLGGGLSTTSKIVIIGKSDDKDNCVNYTLAQPIISLNTLDYSANCGNMAYAAAICAKHAGLIKNNTFQIYNVNTKQTMCVEILPHSNPIKTSIDNNATELLGYPINILYRQNHGIMGSKLLPTGNPTNKIQHYNYSFINGIVPIIIFSLNEFGFNYADVLANNSIQRELIHTANELRKNILEHNNLTKYNKMSIPKLLFLSKTKDNHVQSIYLTPYELHPALAVTGAITLSMAISIKGCIASEICSHVNLDDIQFHHPSGIFRLSTKHHDSETYYSIQRSALILGEVRVEKTNYLE